MLPIFNDHFVLVALRDGFRKKRPPTLLHRRSKSEKRLMTFWASRVRAVDLIHLLLLAILMSIFIEERIYPKETILDSVVLIRYRFIRHFNDIFGTLADGRVASHI